MSRGLPFILLAMFVAGNARAEQSLVDATVVIYNKAVPESQELARFYAQKRGIARDHLIGITCSADEEISREEYDTAIAAPLRDEFRAHGWWQYRLTNLGEEQVDKSSIQFAAVIKGVPLKIRGVQGPYPGDKPGPGPVMDHNEASVDSELSVLAFQSRQISGAATNPYYQNFRAIRDFTPPILLLACRLDGPSVPVVRRMITDSIAAEKTGLWGRAYIDESANSAPGAGVGDIWMRGIAEQLHKVGVPVLYEGSPELIPAGFPMTDCALYYGWYSGNVAGPFAQPDFRFAPGAVAVHIHSFSASTLRAPNAFWVAPLLAHGAAASLGNVYEPYLQLTTHLDLFNDRLLHGFTFAESAYMATQALSWMSVMVGDPLYRPYGAWMQVDQPPDPPRAAANEWKIYHDYATKNWGRPATEYLRDARVLASKTKNAVMLEDLGAIESRRDNLALATSYFQQARATYTRRDDIIRVAIEESDALVRQNKNKRAADLLRSVSRIVSEAPSFSLLQKLEREIAGPSPTPR